MIICVGMCIYLYRFDVTEGQFLLIAELLFTATFGVKGWYYPVCKTANLLHCCSYLYNRINRERSQWQYVWWFCLWWVRICCGTSFLLIILGTGAWIALDDLMVGFYIYQDNLSLPQTCNADDTRWIDNNLEGSILWGDDCRQHALLSSWTVDFAHKGGRKGGTFSCSK